MAQFNNFALSVSLVDAESRFEKEKSQQGPLGKYYDQLKGALGGSENSAYFTERLWSNVLDYDASRTAIEGGFKKARADLQSQNASAILPDLTVDDNGNQQLKVVADSEKYEKSQRAGVDFLADMGSALATMPFSRSSLFKTAVIGGITKVGLKWFDGNYSSPLDDAATGAFVGATVPLVNLTARGAKGVGTLTELYLGKYGAEKTAGFSLVGGSLAFGFTQDVVTRFQNLRADGKTVSESMQEAPRDAFEHPIGTLLAGVAAVPVAGLISREAIARAESAEVATAEEAARAARPSHGANFPVGVEISPGYEGFHGLGTHSGS